MRLMFAWYEGRYSHLMFQLGNGLRDIKLPKKLFETLTLKKKQQHGALNVGDLKPVIVSQHNKRINITDKIWRPRDTSDFML